MNYIIILLCTCNCYLYCNAVVWLAFGRCSAALLYQYVFSMLFNNCFRRSDTQNYWSVTRCYLNMITSSNGNIFRVTGHLCGEFTGPRWIPKQRPVTRSFDVFFDLRLNKRLSKQSWGWWFEMLPCPLWRHCKEGPTLCSWEQQSYPWVVWTSIKDDHIKEDRALLRIMRQRSFLSALVHFFFKRAFVLLPWSEEYAVLLELEYVVPINLESRRISIINSMQS